MSTRELCSRKEVCAELGISKNRFYELVKAGLLTLVKFPTYRRKGVVRRAEVMRLKERLAA